MQYSGVIVFNKHTDLLPFFYTKYNGSYDIENEQQYTKIKARYADERDVRLFLLVRYDGRRTFCRIKCPINPLPVKGEFEVPNMHSICKFLDQQGWVYRDTYNLSMFKG